MDNTTEASLTPEAFETTPEAFNFTEEAFYTTPDASNTTLPVIAEVPSTLWGMEAWGYIMVIIAVGFAALLLFGAVANGLHRCIKGPKKSDSRLEIKSSARRHGPTSFVKDPDFAYYDIESRTNSRKKKNRELEKKNRELEHYRSLERYRAVGNEDRGSELRPRGTDNQDFEGPVMVEDGSTGSSVGSRRSLSSLGQNVSTFASTSSREDVGDGGKDREKTKTTTTITTDETQPQQTSLLQVHSHPTTPKSGKSSFKSERSTPQLTSKQSPPPDLLDQVRGRDTGDSRPELTPSPTPTPAPSPATGSVHGSKTIVYVVGDDFAANVQTKTGPNEMEGYIDEIEEGDFEEPRMYISYL